MRTTNDEARPEAHDTATPDSAWPLVLGFAGYAALLAGTLTGLAIYCSIVL